MRNQAEIIYQKSSPGSFENFCSDNETKSLLSNINKSTIKCFSDSDSWVVAVKVNVKKTNIYYCSDSNVSEEIDETQYNSITGANTLCLDNKEMKNNLEQVIQNDSIKTFTVNGLFQFKYDSTATVKNNMYGSGVDVYTVYKDGEVSETVKLFKPKLTSFEEYCGPGIEVKQMTINYKEVSYCDSKAEPSRTFFYTRGDRTLKVMCQGTNGKVCSYIIPESVVVYIDPVQGIE